MSEAEQRLVSDRANRNMARSLVDAGLAQVKADMTARGIGGRIKDRVVGEAGDALATGVEVARENKPVIAGTIGVLLVWLLRAPLGRAVSKLFGGESEDIQDGDDSARSDKE